MSCNRWGNPVIPYDEPTQATESKYVTLPTITSPMITKAYDDLVTQMAKSYTFIPIEPKEQDMCNSVKRWGAAIEPGSKSSDGSDTYYVRFHHKDKGTTDELTRNFDTFEQALDFVNKTYKDLK